MLNYFWNAEHRSNARLVVYTILFVSIILCLSILGTIWIIVVVGSFVTGAHDIFTVAMLLTFLAFCFIPVGMKVHRGRGFEL